MPWIVSVDPAQASDWCGISVCKVKVWVTSNQVIQKDTQGEYMVALDCLHLERHRGKSYVELAMIISGLLRSRKLADQVPMLILDNSGVGRALGDVLAREDLGSFAIGDFDQPTILMRLTYTGGFKENAQQLHHWTVPKTNIIGSALAMLNQGRLRISPKIVLAPVLEKEFKSYRTKITVNHDEVYVNQDSEHDDLLSAIAQTCFVCGRRWGLKHFGELVNVDAELADEFRESEDAEARANERMGRRNEEAHRAADEAEMQERLKMAAEDFENMEARDATETAERIKEARARAARDASCWGDSDWE